MSAHNIDDEIEHYCLILRNYRLQKHYKINTSIVSNNFKTIYTLQRMYEDCAGISTGFGGAHS